jgi:hypothetical protein
MADTNGWYKRTEYLDPIIAEGLGLSFSGLAPKGRYYGFDQIESGPVGSGIPITLSHATLSKWSDTSNTVQEYALVISPHGTLLYTDNTFNFDIPVNGTPNAKIYLFYVRYTWVETEGGALPLVNYTLVPAIPSDISGDSPDLDALLPDPATDTAIGFLTVPVGGTSFNDLVYAPLDVPPFANKEFDLSIYALLGSPNKFTKTQAWGEQTLTQANITSGGFIVQNTGNVIKLSIVSSSSLEIHSMVDAYSAVGSMFIMYAKTITMSGGSTLKFVTGGNIVFPDNFVPIQINQDDTFIFLKESVSSYRMIGAFQSNVASITSLVDAVTTLEADLDLKADLSGRNQFLGLQEWSAAPLTQTAYTGTPSVAGYITIPDTGNEFIFTGDGTKLLIKGFKRSNGNQLIAGSIISIMFVNIDVDSEFVYYNNPQDGFLTNGLGNWPIMNLGHYIIQREYTGNSVGMYSIHMDLVSLMAEKWVEITDLVNGHVAGTPIPEYWIDPMGLVHFRGMIDSESATNIEVVTLPTVIRPTNTVYFALVEEASGDPQSGYIEPTGKMYFHAFGSTGHEYHLTTIVPYKI